MQMSAAVQISAAASAAGKFTPREENQKFANDASYESVRRLLAKLAGKCFMRVQAMGGLGMTLDDVMQEMNLSYLQARDNWKPDQGTKFSSYLVNCCYWNFNGRISRREKERRLIGMVNMTDMRPAGSAHSDDDEQDLMEVYGNDCTEISVTLLVPGMNNQMELIEGGANVEEAQAHMGVNPELLLEQRQVAKQNLLEIPHLTKDARAFALKLLSAANKGEDLPTIRAFAAERGLGPTSVRRLRVELSTKFGVKC